MKVVAVDLLMAMKAPRPAQGVGYIIEAQNDRGEDWQTRYGCAVACGACAGYLHEARDPMRKSWPSEGEEEDRG